MVYVFEELKVLFVFFFKVYFIMDFVFWIVFLVVLGLRSYLRFWIYILFLFLFIFYRRWILWERLDVLVKYGVRLDNKVGVGLNIFSKFWFLKDYCVFWILDIFLFMFFKCMVDNFRDIILCLCGIKKKKSW